jgi:hypothetical protein
MIIIPRPNYYLILLTLFVHRSTCNLIQKDYVVEQKSILIIAINEVNERMHVKQEMFCLCETLLRAVIILYDPNRRDCLIDDTR